MGGVEYEIITVDWKPEQTRIWRHWVSTFCPNAKIITIPDTKPIKWSWSAGKIDCFLWGFETDRIIYMDTDVIVTHDLEELFDLMGDAVISASSAIPLRQTVKVHKKLYEKIAPHFQYKYGPVNFSSGLIALKGFDPMTVYEGWRAVLEFPPFVDVFKKRKVAEEEALSVWMATHFEEDQIHHQPYEIHGNICGKKYFGDTNQPWAIHYHRPKRLIDAGLGKWLKLRSS